MADFSEYYDQQLGLAKTIAEIMGPSSAAANALAMLKDKGDDFVIILGTNQAWWVLSRAECDYVLSRSAEETAAAERQGKSQ